MKKIFQYLALIALLSVAGIIVTNKDTFRPIFQKAGQRLHIIDKPCDKPLTYAIGTVDPRFNISQADFQNTIEQAQKIWENAIGRQLFQYDPNSTFKINLVYDDRQANSQEAQKMEKDLNTLQNSHEAIINQYNNVSSAYKKRLDDYNSAVADYEKKLDKYNNEVDSWNAKGGAPEDTYNDLKKQKSDLEDTYNKLEKERKAIDVLVGQNNNLAAQEKNIVNTYNSNLTTYQNKYGQPSQFDKGVYDGKEIDIYQFNALDDLRLTIAHELGHYLGLDHVENSKSIMYYLMGDQDINNPQPSAEDISAFKNVCQMQ
jgi:hypothetical protein